MPRSTNTPLAMGDAEHAAIDLFAIAMKDELTENLHKGGRDVWRQESQEYLFGRLAEEMEELREAVASKKLSDQILAEAADVANFALMIADAAHALPDVVPLVSTVAAEPESIPMLIWCPMRDCQARHIDVGEFATKRHHTHSCQSCGHTWRPAVVATVGVQFLPGFKNKGPEGGSLADLKLFDHGLELGVVALGLMDRKFEHSSDGEIWVPCMCPTGCLFVQRRLRQR